MKRSSPDGRSASLPVAKRARSVRSGGPAHRPGGGAARAGRRVAPQPRVAPSLVAGCKEKRGTARERAGPPVPRRVGRRGGGQPVQLRQRAHARASGPEGVEQRRRPHTRPPDGAEPRHPHHPAPPPPATSLAPSAPFILATAALEIPSGSLCHAP